MNNTIEMAAMRAEALQALIQAVVHLEDAEFINGDFETRSETVVKQLVYLYEEEVNRLRNINIVTGSIRAIDKNCVGLLIDADTAIREAAALVSSMGDMLVNMSLDTMNENFWELSYLLLNTTKAFTKGLRMLAIA